MNARNQLNLVYSCLAALVAGSIGLAAGSWTVFGVSLIAIVGVAILERAIRPRFR